VDAIISMVAGLIRCRPGWQPSRQDSELSSGGGRVEVMGWGVGDQIPSLKGPRRVGGSRASASTCQKTTTRKRGDMAVRDRGCLFFPGQHDLYVT
jgi:hypothetical protein